jgi:hypothetical protein
VTVIWDCPSFTGAERELKVTFAGPRQSVQLTVGP